MEKQKLSQQVTAIEEEMQLTIESYKEILK